MFFALLFRSCFRPTIDPPPILDRGNPLWRNAHRGRFSSRGQQRSIRSWKLKVGTWNVSSLKHKKPEMVDEATKYHLDVVGLSSTKIKGNGIEELPQGWTLYYAGVDPSVRSQAGVGILTSPRLADSVVEWVPISSRVGLLRLHLPEGKNLAIVQAYAPNAVAEYTAFLDDLEQGFARVQASESLMLLGDFNAHVGSDTDTWHGVIGKHGAPDLNPSGELLLDFCANHALAIMNTFFEHRDLHKYTWYRDSLSQRSLIDFIMVSSDLKRRVMDVRVKRGAELSGADHHLVVASLRYSGREPARRRGQTVTRVRWEALQDRAVQDRMASQVAEQYIALPGVEADVETEWTLLKSAILGAAVSCCGLKRVGVTPGGHKRTPWWNQDVKRIVGEKKACFRQWLANKTPFTRSRYEESRRAAARAVAEAKVKAWEQFGEAMEGDYRGANKRFWQTVRRLRNPEGRTIQVIKDKNGNILKEVPAIADRWKEHFEELLNPATADPPIPELHFRAETKLAVEEVWQAVNRLKSGKAAGVDEIRPEMLKALGGEGIAWLTRVFQVAWDCGTVPDEWQTAVIVPIFKKGSRADCNNYRGISLLSLPGKVYAKVLESRIRGVIEPQISDEQCGFRGGRSTSDQVFILRQICEKAWEFALPVFMCFVDLEKAYDRVPRDKLWDCLREYGVDGELIRAIQSLYKRCSACVRINGCKSTRFPVGTGLRQGCVLSPLLFIVFMDRIMRRSRGPEGIAIGDVFVSSLQFADDLWMAASSAQDLQSSLDRVAAECEAAGMRISTSKTETLVLSRQPVDCNIQVSGSQIRQVEEFKYLGVLFASDGKQDREMDRRINQASAILCELGRMVISNRHLSKKARLSVYKSLYRSVLTYGHESWIMTERTRSRIQASEMRFLRKIEGVSRIDRIRNSTIRDALNIEPLLLWIEKSQLRWFGHVLRMPADRIARRIFEARPGGTRPVGKPRARWCDQVQKLCLRTGLTVAEIESTATDRGEWTRLLNCLPPQPN